MRSKISLLALSALVVSGCAMAQAPKEGEDHSAHHPSGNAPATALPATGSASTPQVFERQMKSMQEMHQKMQAAKTPVERAALMDEHIKLMQSGMAMMGQMRGSRGIEGIPGMAAGMGGFSPGGAGMGSPSAMPGTNQATTAAGAGMTGMMGMHMQMERRMAMMEQMMQMMVDRESINPRK
ncbi:MAG: hypothetical protein EB072_04520 [Betaproteobacteria bacterium]|nr:hypothetical protein [Betaproteobacteria bacterium]